MNTLMRCWIIVGLTAVLAGPCWAGAVSGSPEVSLSMQSLESATLHDEVAVGQALRLNDVYLEGETSTATLALERFEVFEPDARIVIHRRNGRQRVRSPGGVYFRGSIDGDPDSIAVLSADRSGEMRGVVQSRDRLWVLGGSGRDRGARVHRLASHELEDALGRPGETHAFRCEADTLPRPPGERASVAPSLAAPLPPGQTYQVPIAIETDAEFYNKFNNTDKATAYVGSLFAYASTIYRREASAELKVAGLSLWAGGVDSDPWNHADTLDGLTSFENYWNANRRNVTRATAHFLSGKKLGGGVAYLGALCETSWGYGYSANLAGDLSQASLRTIWDTLVVTHEIGHNFDSQHTHDYEGIGGDARPVDSCYRNGGPGSLPGLGSLTGGTPGAGTGTIMSYCHLVGGGYSNVSMTFGQDHAYGIKPYRVSDVIRNYVAKVAAAHPSCIKVSAGQTFSLAVTKTGNGTVSSSPSGISCGTVCTAAFQTGATVTLTASPASGFTFAGWGEECSGQNSASCVLQLTRNRAATARFSVATGVTLTASAATPKFGDSVVFSAQVSGTGPTGTVAFKDGAVVLGTVAVSANRAGLNVSSLSVGSHSIVAAYSGDSKLPASASKPLVVTVGKRTSMTVLGAAPSASRLGDPVTLTATVAGKGPVGSVTFKDGSAVLGSNPISAGRATILVANLARGIHSLSATYGGDGNHSASSSAVLRLNVAAAAKTASTTRLSVSPAAPRYGQSVGLTVAVSGKSPTGTVTFRDSGINIGRVAVSAGQAKLTASTLAVGRHNLVASYSGDAGNSSSTSNTVVVAVRR